MSSKDKKSVKSDKSKDKKKKTTKLEKKDSNPPPTEGDQLLIARVISRQGDKESKSIANAEVDDPYMQTQSTFSPKRVNNPPLENQSAVHPQDNYNTVPFNNQYRMNKFMADPLYQDQFANQHMTMQPNPYPFQGQLYNHQSFAQPQQTRPQFYQQSYNNDVRYDRMKDQINMSLLPKKQEILTQLQKVDDRIQQIQLQSQKIESMTREECEMAIDRLKAAEHQKLQYLYHDKNELTKDIEQIDRLIMRFQSIQDYNSPQNIDFFENLERIVNKRTNVQLDIYSDDLPQDFVNLKRLHQQNQMLTKLMDFKNEVIWKLFQDQQSENKRVKDDFFRQANQEFQEWQNMVDQYQQELNKYKLKCVYCGIDFDYQLINTNCNFNQAEARIQWDCEDNPPQEFFGTKRHFFSKPKQLQQSQVQMENSKI